MVNIPVAQALTGLINSAPNGPTGNGTLDGVDARWKFSSTYRELIQQGRAANAVDVAVREDLGIEFEGEAPTLSTFPILNGDPIVMAINPKSVEFEQAKRIQQKNFRNGAVFFHFANSRGQNNDILKIRFQGNTGNIDLRGSLRQPRDATRDTGALRKMQTWWNLYHLTREPMLLNNGTLNEFTIKYTSHLLPRPITFYGFFGAVMQFSENADKPNSREYSFEFTVLHTDPDLDQYPNEVINTLISYNTNQEATDVSTLFGVGVDSAGE